MAFYEIESWWGFSVFFTMVKENLSFFLGNGADSGLNPMDLFRWEGTVFALSTEGVFPHAFAGGWKSPWLQGLALGAASLGILGMALRVFVHFHKKNRRESGFSSLDTPLPGDPLQGTEPSFLEDHILLRYISKNVPVMLAAIHSSGNIVYWNQECARVTGYNSGEIIGYPLEFQKRFTPLLEILNNSEEWNQGGDLLHGKAIWIQCKQGEKRVIAVTVLEEDGEPLDRFFWIVGLDITRQHEEDEERRELEARLRYAQKWDDLGILSGGLAHNFNNLLMCIMGNTELARLGLPPDSSVQINLNQIERASKQAAVLCQKMQSYTGKCHLVMVPKDLRQFTEELVPLITERIPESIEFRAEYHLIPGQFIPVQMDVGRFREGMMGLLENAIEAIGPSPGGIRLCVGVEPCDPQDLSSRWILPDFEPGLFGYFEWIDTGCGMDEEIRFSIFDPFYTTKFLGRGLGLPSVLGIVRRHGGTLCVHSEPGRGTSVKVFLPVVKEESGLEPQT